MDNNGQNQMPNTNNQMNNNNANMNGNPQNNMGMMGNYNGPVNNYQGNMNGMNNYNQQPMNNYPNNMGMNNNYQGNYNAPMNNPAPKKDKKKIFIIIGAVIVVILVLLYIIGGKTDTPSENNTNNTNNNTNTNTNTNTENNTNNNTNNNDATNTNTNTTPTSSEDAIKKNIAFTYEKTEIGDILVFVKNNNSFPIYLKVTYHYYDANGNKVGYDTDFSFVNINAGETQIQKLANRTTENYDHYEMEFVEIVTDPNRMLVNASNNIEIISKRLYKDNNGLTNVEFEARNNGEKAIETATFYVLFKRNGKIYDVERKSEYDLQKKGDTVKLRVFIDKTTCDDFEIYYWGHSYR